jgi:ferredoxin
MKSISHGLRFRGQRPARCSVPAASVVIDEDTCMVDLARRIMHFYAHESCGWCIPCREGTAWLRKMLDRFHSGGGRAEDIRWSASWRKTCWANVLSAGRRRGAADDQHRQEMAATSSRSTCSGKCPYKPADVHGRGAECGVPEFLIQNGRFERQSRLKIDDRDGPSPPGTLVIEAARRMGIEVPSFCYYPGLSLQAACRMCLVEVEKAPKLQTACTLVATEGMVVRTTPAGARGAQGHARISARQPSARLPGVRQGRRMRIAGHGLHATALDKSRFAEEKLHNPSRNGRKLVYYDAPRCILCFRCVRVCDEGMDVKALGVGAARRRNR